MELEALLSHDLLAMNELEMSLKICKKAMFTGDFHDTTLSKTQSARWSHVILKYY